MALQYVGSATGTGTGATYSVSLTALTGGLSASAAIGDIVIVASGWSDTVDAAPGVTTAGYTELTELYSNDTRDANLSVSYKVLATAETSVTVSSSNNAANGGATVVHVWRGIDPDTPIDVTSTTATGINGCNADAPAITALTKDAVLLAIGGGTGATTQTAPAAAPTGYSNLRAVDGDGTSMDFFVAVASKVVTTPEASEDPAAYTAGATSNSDSWAAVTVALRPDFPKVSTFTDDFTSLDTTTVWTANNDAGTTSSAVSGVLEQAINSGATSGYARIQGRSYLSLIASSIYVRLIQPVQGTFSGVGVEVNFDLLNAGTADHRLQFVVNSDNTLAAWYYLAGTGHFLVNATYSPTNHAWLRIRESGGTIFWDTAPDASGSPGTWTNFTSLAASTVTGSFSLESLRPFLLTGRNGTVTGTATGPGKWDGLNTTAGSGISATFAATESGSDTLASSATLTVAATFAATDSTDTLAATSTVLIAAAFAATESGSDVLAAPSQVKIAGTLAATEASTADTFAATETVIVTATFAIAETGSDTLASTATVVIAGTFAATETSDTFAATAALAIVGTFAAIETVADVLSSTATVTVAATLTATEAGSDTLSAPSTVKVAATFAASESGADTFFAQIGQFINATIALVESGADTLAGTSTVIVSATFAASEIGADTFVEPAAVYITAVLAATESAPDSLSGSAALTVAATVAAVESGADQLGCSAAVVVAAVLAAAETGVDIFAASASQAATATFALIEVGTDVFAGTASNIVTATLAATEGGSGDACAGQVSVYVACAVSVQETNADAFNGGAALEIVVNYAPIETGLDTFLAYGSSRPMELYPLIATVQGYPGTSQSYPLQGIEQGYPL